MRVRYAIEHGYPNIPNERVFMALVDRGGDVVGGQLSGYASEAEAKAVAEQSTPDLKWKPAPKEWQPDTYLVSNYFEDEGWDNRG